MKDETRKAFQEALNQFDARERAANKERIKKLIEREKFETGFERARTGIIIPALDSIAEMLRARGWQCILADDTPTKTKMEIYKGNMAGLASGSRPHIMFEIRPTSFKVRVYAASQLHAGEEGEYALSEVTSDKVNELVLNLFRSLVSEGTG
jgi:hypothetical protein